MPLFFGEIPSDNIPLFFKNLLELDDWNSRSHGQKRLDDVLAYTPRTKSVASGRLLVNLTNLNLRYVDVTHFLYHRFAMITRFAFPFLCLFAIERQFIRY